MQRNLWVNTMENSRSLLAAILCLYVAIPPIQIEAQTILDVPNLKNDNPRLDYRLQSLGREVPSAKLVASRSSIRMTDGGKVIVIIEPSPGLLAADIDRESLLSMHVEIIAESRSLLRVAVPIDSIDAISQLRGVNFVRLPYRPNSNSTVSEGVSLIGADHFHENGLQGAGVKVAIIDEGFSGADQLPNDMPREWANRDFTRQGMYSGGVHGTACAEIVYDIAPEASMYLMRVDDLVDLENAKDYCISEGIRIVSHSMSWLGTGFGDGRGLACDIADDAASNGVLWVNSAGNYAQRQYSGLWADSNSNNYHDAVSAQNELIMLDGVAVGDTIVVWLTWNEWPTTSQDYDLVLYRQDSLGQLSRVAESSNTQRNTKPVEVIEHVVEVGDRYGIAVWKDASARGTVVKVWSANHDIESQASLVGNLGTPADARGSFSVGAVYTFDWNNRRIAPYSSKGPTIGVSLHRCQNLL